jgi:hypothetical protein
MASKKGDPVKDRPLGQLHHHANRHGYQVCHGSAAGDFEGKAAAFAGVVSM